MARLEWKHELDQYTGLMKGVKLFRGWDNTGNAPACVVVQIVGPFMLQVLREYYDERMGIVDFTNMVLGKGEADFPGAEWVDYCDPAGFAEHADREGGLTSPARLQREVCGLEMIQSEQTLKLRIDSVDQMLARRDGMLIDPSCVRLLNGFTANYVYEENVRMGIMEFKEMPKKNRASHLHDALQYVVVKLFSPLTSAAPTPEETFDSAWRDVKKRHEVLQGVGRTGYTNEREFSEGGRRGNTGGTARDWRRRT